MISSIVYNEDCLIRMKKFKDKYFDLAIIDPPYGLDKKLCNGGGKLKNTPMSKLYKDKNWDKLPNEEYWKQLFRISKNQIIFGANYFLDFLPSTRGFIVWDKKQFLTTLSECELIWTSFNKPAKIIKKSSMDIKRFHPTQKPIYIYKFCLQYANIKKGKKIIDTHLGSGSSRIAAYDYELDFTGFETDLDYYNKQNIRFENHKKQLKIKF